MSHHASPDTHPPVPLTQQNASEIKHSTEAIKSSKSGLCSAGDRGDAGAGINIFKPEADGDLSCHHASSSGDLLWQQKLT